MLTDRFSEVRADFRRQEGYRTDDKGCPDDFVPDKSKGKPDGQSVEACRESENGKCFQAELLGERSGFSAFGRFTNHADSDKAEQGESNPVIDGSDIGGEKRSAKETGERHSRLENTEKHPHLENIFLGSFPAAKSRRNGDGEAVNRKSASDQKNADKIHKLRNP